MIAGNMTHLLLFETGAALVLIALGGFVAIMNWWMVITTCRTGRHHSVVPLVGALFLGAGLALMPRTRHYAWAAALADYGTLIVLYSLPRLVREAFETSRYNLLAEYRGGRGIMTASISLFRHGICIIKHNLKRAPGELGMVSMSRVGTWNQDRQRLTLQVGGTSAEFEMVTEAEGEVLRQVSGFSEETSELSLAEVELLR